MVLQNSDIEELLAMQIRYYTRGESSSVTITLAEELTKSITYSIDLYLNSQGDSLVKDVKPSMLLELAKPVIEKEIKHGKALLRLAKSTMPPTANIAYKDTIAGIETFFSCYDYRFFAHEVPGNIDYQLAIPVSEDLQGISYVNAYLLNLCIENKFCGKFTTSQLQEITKNYCKEFNALHINIFEPVADFSILAQFEKSDIANAISEVLGITDSAVINYIRDYVFRSYTRLCLLTKS